MWWGQSHQVMLCLLFRQFSSNKSSQGRLCSCHSPPYPGSFVVLCLIPSSSLEPPPRIQIPLSFLLTVALRAVRNVTLCTKLFSPVCKMKYWFVLIQNYFVVVVFLDSRLYLISYQIWPTRIHQKAYSLYRTKRAFIFVCIYTNIFVYLFLLSVSYEPSTQSHGAGCSTSSRGV